MMFIYSIAEALFMEFIMLMKLLPTECFRFYIQNFADLLTAEIRDHLEVNEDGSCRNTPNFPCITVRIKTYAIHLLHALLFHGTVMFLSYIGQFF